MNLLPIQVLHQILVLQLVQEVVKEVGVGQEEVRLLQEVLAEEEEEEPMWENENPTSHTDGRNQPAEEESAEPTSQNKKRLK